MAIKRYFNEKNFERIKEEFKFFFNFMKKSFGEYDFAIRDNYFNIYYKGNSLAKVTPKKDVYEISIHSKFIEGNDVDGNEKYNIVKKGDYSLIKLAPNQLHPFFQVKNMNKFASNIKNVNNGEEITFEQMIITDNLKREDFIFIDRQVTDTDLKRKRLDLLALRQIKEGNNNYNFVVCEVKMGNNTELSIKNDNGKIKVLDQTEFYINHIKDNFDDYKECYEKHYSQKNILGLIDGAENINIEKPVEGLILVGGYSNIAKKQVEGAERLEGELKKTMYSHIKYKAFDYII